MLEKSLGNAWGCTERRGGAGESRLIFLWNGSIAFRALEVRFVTREDETLLLLYIDAVVCAAIILWFPFSTRRGVDNGGIVAPWREQWHCV